MTLKLSKLLPLAAALALVTAVFVYGSDSNEAHEPVKLLAAPASEVSFRDGPQRDDRHSRASATFAIQPVPQAAFATPVSNPGAAQSAPDSVHAVPLTPIPQYGPDGAPLKRAATPSAENQDSGTPPMPGRNWTTEQTRAAFGERDRIANMQRANEGSNPPPVPRPDAQGAIGAIGASKTEAALR